MKLLKKLYYQDAKSNSDSMFKFTEMVETLCHQRGATVAYDSYGNLYVTKGKAKSYSCIASHLDEVHNARGKNFRVVVEHGDIIKGYDDIEHGIRHGIGADDKNGIWVALRCLETTRAIKLVFFLNEEVGCLGSSNAQMEFFRDCRFVLQIDRRNNDDFITEIGGTELCDAEFIRDVNPTRWGYKVTSGLTTDVAELKESGLAIACCNMSCGYYNPHTDNEFTSFSDLKKCLRFVKHIIRDCNRVYNHVYEDPYYGRYSARGVDSSFWYRPTTGKTKKEEKKDKVENEVNNFEYNEVKREMKSLLSDFKGLSKRDLYDEISYILGGVSYSLFEKVYSELNVNDATKEEDESTLQEYIAMANELIESDPEISDYDSLVQAFECSYYDYDHGMANQAAEFIFGRCPVE